MTPLDDSAGAPCGARLTNLVPTAARATACPVCARQGTRACAACTIQMSGGGGGGGGGKRRKTGPAAPSGRAWTVSVALPGSIVANAQTAELKTYLAGQVARAAVVFNVDEIVVFADRRTPGDSSKSTQVRCWPAGLLTSAGLRLACWPETALRHPAALVSRGAAAAARAPQGQFQGAVKGASFDADVFLARILQYLETPQCVPPASRPASCARAVATGSSSRVPTRSARPADAHGRAACAVPGTCGVSCSPSTRTCDTRAS